MMRTASSDRAGISRRGFIARGALAAASLAGGGSVLSACSGGGDGGAAGGAGAVTWQNFANPGEAELFKKYSADYQAKYGVKTTYQTVVGDYQSKLLTQLAGGTAPDAFYVGDSSMSKLIESGQIEDLTGYLDSADADVKLDDFFPGLLEWCKSKDGKLYGMPVDCNPKAFWFNSTLLQEAGVALPVDQFTAGTWNQAALDDLLTKVKATGKRGMIVESNWFDLFSLVTTFGGTAFDEDGKAVFDTDPKAQEVLAWLFDHFAADTITYGGSLPKGQASDALFYGEQLATIQAGRYVLPNLKKLKKITYDLAPMPSDTGKDVKPVAVYCAAMSVNVKAKSPDAARTFMARYVNADGQRARLSGGGNAVPAVSGLDEVVTEDNLPPNAKYLTEIARKGYAIPLALARNPELGANFATEVDTLIKGGADSKKFSQDLARLLNAKV